MPRGFLAVAIATAVASFFLAPRASAQVVTSPTNIHVNHTPSGGRLYNQFNRADCIGNEPFSINLPVDGTGLPSLQIEVWAGTGCQDSTNRQAGSAQCRRVTTPVQAQTPTTPLELWLRDIVAPDSTSVPGMRDETICSEAQTVGGKQALPLHFLLLDSNGQEPMGVSHGLWEIEYDLVGPHQPTAVSAGIGERALVVSWDEPDDSGVLITGYKLCWEQVGTGVGPGDAGTEGGAGGETSDGPDAGPGGCTSATLIPGDPPPLGHPSCREVQGAATNAEAAPLENGVTYAVAVAAVDDFDNDGDLSEIVCGTPEPVTGFFEAYRAAGGGAGGGFCSLGARPARTAGIGVLLLALGLAFRRGRRRAPRAGSRGSA